MTFRYESEDVAQKIHFKNPSFGNSPCIYCFNAHTGGPMLGYNTMREVLVWLQTVKPQQVKMVYFPSGKADLRDSCLLHSRSEEAHAVRLIASDLQAGQTYTYQIYLDDAADHAAEGNFSTQTLWQHRSDPPEFKFAIGSCAYINEAAYDRPGEPYGKGLGIFNSILEKEPEMMLWLGDNIYLREGDWSSQSGIYHRYTHFRGQKELQKFWKSMHHYAIWDDHDYGPNDADRSFVSKKRSLNAFKTFWGNYEYGINGKDGISSQFSYNDLDFFLLDNRYFRSPNHRKSGKREILGEEQVQWLIDALVYSKATFKVVLVGGQFLSPAAVYENHATYGEERRKIIELMEQEELKNVIFLSGDRHKTELTKMELENGHLIYDYTCSPLSSKAYDSRDEGNNLRVEGTHVSTQNFGLLSVTGSLKERKLLLQNFDSKGNLLWKYEIEKQ